MLDGKIHSRLNLRGVMENPNLCLELNVEVELLHTIFFPYPCQNLEKPRDKAVHRYFARPFSVKPFSLGVLHNWCKKRKKLNIMEYYFFFLIGK